MRQESLETDRIVREELAAIEVEKSLREYVFTLERIAQKQAERATDDIAHIGIKTRILMRQVAGLSINLTGLDGAGHVMRSSNPDGSEGIIAEGIRKLAELAKEGATSLASFTTRLAINLLFEAKEIIFRES